MSAAVVVASEAGTEGVPNATEPEVMVPAMPHTVCTVVVPTVVVEKEQEGTTTVVVRAEPAVANVHAGCTYSPELPAVKALTVHLLAHAASEEKLKVPDPNVGHENAPFAIKEGISVIDVHTDSVMVVVDPGFWKKRRGWVTVINPIAALITEEAAMVAPVTGTGA